MSHFALVLGSGAHAARAMLVTDLLTKCGYDTTLHSTYEGYMLKETALKNKVQDKPGTTVIFWYVGDSFIRDNIPHFSIEGHSCDIETIIDSLNHKLVESNIVCICDGSCDGETIPTKSYHLSDNTVRIVYACEPGKEAIEIDSEGVFTKSLLEIVADQGILDIKALSHLTLTNSKYTQNSWYEFLGTSKNIVFTDKHTSALIISKETTQAHAIDTHFKKFEADTTFCTKITNQEILDSVTTFTEKIKEKSLEGSRQSVVIYIDSFNGCELNYKTGFTMDESEFSKPEPEFIMLDDILRQIDATASNLDIICITDMSRKNHCRSTYKIYVNYRRGYTKCKNNFFIGYTDEKRKSLVPGEKYFAERLCEYLPNMNIREAFCKAMDDIEITPGVQCPYFEGTI